MNIKREVRLIMADAKSNHNKFWYGFLYENGDVQTRWGRVGKSEQSKNFPNAGEIFLNRKAREKERKGYRDLKIISSNTNHTVENSDLHEIAKRQIKTSGNPELDKLIEKLVRFNVHKITSSTNISFDETSGVFSTPLGVVTLDAITQARALLSDIHPLVNTSNFKSNKWNDYLNEYLTLIPQDIGMRRITPERLFGDLKAVSAQNDILDSLEASYKTIQTSDRKQTTKTDVPDENVFDLALDIVDDQTFSRIEEKYHKTRKDIHVCSHLQVKKVFVVKVGHMKNAFEVGSQVGNIQELWHGTSMANVLSILKSGLHKSPPSSAHVTGKMFGNGLYFAVDSTKSLNYAYGYWSGQRNNNCYMFLSDVAMGKEYVPTNGFDSSVERKVNAGGYNSCWAKANKSGVRNDECIIYNDNQCNLTYLVEFDA